jgi:DNA-binding XRE family transcriptional regulator
MPLAKESPPRKTLRWSPRLIRDLRGKRSQAEFGGLLGVAKNTVWRWEAGYAEPEAAAVARLTELAERENFLADWHLVGSITRIGNLEEGSRQIAEMIKASLARTTREIG